MYLNESILYRVLLRYYIMRTYSLPKNHYNRKDAMNKARQYQNSIYNIHVERLYIDLLYFNILLKCRRTQGDISDCEQTVQKCSQK